MISYLNNQPFSLSIKKEITILNDCFILIQCGIFNYLILLANTEKEFAYSIGTFYCFILIMHKLICGVYYFQFLKGKVFRIFDLEETEKLLNQIDDDYEKYFQKKINSLNQQFSQFERFKQKKKIKI
eukprot:TRINITY_DN3665_c0_g1_i2.p3 TRINITY_DN3665_c0_g1~~TRINITY_DN3665_c0_g1_i2.p3  ORF type:complete len:127 (-),score=22.56 TRINITY_DN3665_c0_g1_i2:191-571(-)